MQLDRSIGVAVRRQKLTYLSADKIDSLYDCIASVYDSQSPGDFVEFGVALGGSGICLALALDNIRRYLGFDVFGMIPPPTGHDGPTVHERYDIIKSGKSGGIGGDRYYGYVDNLLEVVKSNFASFGCAADDKRVYLVKGFFADTLQSYSDIRVGIAHIDCDWYEPVHYCIDFVWPRLSAGGFIILDDYNDWDGCKKATKEFLSSNDSAELIRTRPHAVIKKGPT